MSSYFFRNKQIINMKPTIIKQASIIIMFALTAVIYFNCDDSGVNPTNNPLTISGQISGWNLGNKTLSARIESVTGHNYEIANCPIDASGNFSLTLPATVSDTTLYSGDSVFTMGCSGTVTINPADSKGTRMWRFNVMDTITVLGYIRFCNYDTLFAGAFEDVFLYVNKDLSVSGTQYCFPGDTIMYNGTAKSGWNTVYENYIRKFSAYGYVILYNNTQPSGGAWKFVSFY